MSHQEDMDKLASEARRLASLVFHPEHSGAAHRTYASEIELALLEAFKTGVVAGREETLEK